MRAHFEVRGVTEQELAERAAAALEALSPGRRWSIDIDAHGEVVSNAAGDTTITTWRGEVHAYPAFDV